MTPPTMKPVNSTNIAAVGYDAAERRLYVKFKGQDGVYSYADVPADKHQQFLAAKSPGAYFYQHIRNAHAHQKPD